MGSNLGDRGAALQGALDALRAEGVCVEAVSPVFETAPQDLVDQPAFLNAAARVRTRLDPRGLLALLKRIERTLGRVPEGVRFGPRPIDADILLWDGGAWRDEALEIPHPRLVRRRFAGNFADSKELLSGYNVGEADGILFDLGVSSFQFDEGERGFSYRFDALLDMRMDQTSSLSAKTIVNTYPAEEIADIIYRYGEEPFARPISRKIVEYRENRPIETTFELVEIIKSALPPLILRRKGHPAKQTFQALRIAVNDELGNLKRALAEAASLLAPKGRLVVITFHSLEDRICKEYFRKISTIEIPRDLPVILDEEPPFRLVLRHVLKPSEGEIETNNRAHSAKLRVIEKT